MYGYGNSMFLATHGILARTASGGGIDPDAQAFITAASITDPTQQSAINQLVVDLKGYGIWTKLRACYPFIGGTSSTHKWNLKDPRDLDAAFRLVFNGGFTHSSTGATPNGTNGYANTFLNYFTQLTNSNLHFSWYSRTALNNGAFSCEMIPNGNYTAPNWSTFRINNKISGNAYFSAGDDNAGATISQTQSGFFIGSETASNNRKFYRNGSAIATNATNDTNQLPNVNLNFWGNTLAQYSANNCAFASIGDGLTDTEAANFYTAVQAFQTTLGRSIGTQTVSDADAQAFVTNAGIVDQVEANAVNNLVIGLKADSLWTKMSAIYPMVGGTASAHKFNLKDPRDLDTAFRLVFSGGWTHSSTGALPNGTNAYANTYFNASLYSTNHLSYYSRKLALGVEIEMGCFTNTNSVLFNRVAQQYVAGSLSSFPSYTTTTDARGFWLGSKRANNDRECYRNGISEGTSTINDTAGFPNFNIFLGARNNIGAAEFYTTKECAFASIGDGLTDAEALNLNSRVTTFQTALNRNV